MPHATDDMSNLTNGSSPQSKFLSHATSYPVVSDSIEAVKSHPYGKKALEIADGAYQKFGKPVEPYLETPYSYAKPYVAKADELADSGLHQVDGRFPIVKEDTQTVVDTGKSYVFWPYNYVYDTYSDEYRKTANRSNGSTGLAVLIQAIISTQLKFVSDAFQLIADILGPRYRETKKKSSDYVRAGQDKGSEYLRQGQDAAEHYRQIGQDTAEHYRQVGQQTVNDLGQKVDETSAQWRERMNEAKGQAQQSADQAKGQAKETKDQAKSSARETKEEAKARTGGK